MSKKIVYVVDGARSPQLKARGKRGPFSASDLAVHAGKALLARQPFKATDLDEVIMGCVMSEPDEVNIGRIISLRLGCGKKVPAWTVQRNCASGMQALDCARLKILAGESHLVLAGGTEAMSRAPLLFNDHMVDWLSALGFSKTVVQKLQVISKFRPSFLAPIIGILKGLSDPIAGISMGETAENLAQKFNITRTEMDAFAVESHRKVVEAVSQQVMDEIVPIISDQGVVYDADDGVRPDSSLESLAKLRPVFDKKFGMVTAGNSAQITDGAAMLILASSQAVKKYKLPILGTLDDVQWSGLAPEQMGLGPAYSMPPLLERNNLEVKDIDAWEINEAFAAQMIGNLRALQDADFCKEELGWDKPVGKIPDEKLNREGGGIAIGHPVGASGARIVLHLLKSMQRNKEKHGIASLCIGGGQGGAVLVSGVES